MKKEMYKHDYSGNCGPYGAEYFSNTTFSVGCFRWIPKAGGTGLKKSAVKIRIKGYSFDPQKVYDKAEEICRKLNAGWLPKTKTIFVGGKDAQSCAKNKI